MSNIELMDGVGIQNGGEPVVPEPEPTPKPTPEPPAPEEPTPEPEPTPEQIQAAEEHKKLTGSARQKARAERAEREAAELRDRLSRLEAQVNPTAAKPAEQQGEPKLEDFASFAEYNKAAIRYEAQQLLKEERAKEQQTKVVQSWESKKAEARKEFEDFDEVLADMEPPSGVVVAVMNESELTAKIAYHLAQHPEEMRKINQMRPGAAALAIGRIEADLAKPKAPTPKPASKAPAPVKPVAPSASAAPSRVTGVEIY